MQGGSPRQPQEGLEEGCGREHHLPHLPHYRLLHWMLRFQEQQRGQCLPKMEGIPLERRGWKGLLLHLLFVMFSYSSLLGFHHLFDFLYILF